MGRIFLETTIKAPIERCFDLSRSVDLHLISAEETHEKAVGGVTKGLLKLGDVVTWEAWHFGVKQRLTVEITEFNHPYYFQDAQVKGIFKTFHHNHHFIVQADETLMKDEFVFECPFGPLGQIVDPIIKNHLKKFLVKRNQVIKEIAEGDDWISVLP